MATATNLVPHKIFLAWRWVDSPNILRVENPARPGEPAGLTYQATPEQYEEAVQAAVAAFEVTRKLPAYERAATLRASSRSSEEASTLFPSKLKSGPKVDLRDSFRRGAGVSRII